MRVLLLCSEYEGLIKTGGLADACRGIAQGLVEAGHQVTVLLPRYTSLYSRPTAEWHSVYLSLGGQRLGCAVRQLAQSGQAGVDIRLLEHHDFFHRERPYDDGEQGYADNALRFAFFCKAALEWCRQHLPDVELIHGHDWQTAVTAAYLKQHYARDPVLAKVPFVFTIHNGAYQLTAGAEWFEKLDIAQGQDHFLNMLEQGIRCATKFNTVSQGYRDELLSEPAANGLARLYQQRQHDFSGILNGCDYQQWDPATDPHLVKNYQPQDLSGKKACKQQLKARFHLPDADVPLLVAVSRITGQKGYDYLVPALRQFLARSPVQVFIVGSGEQHYCRQLYQLQEDFPAQFRFFEGFDETLAHQTEAAGDFFLMPSLFEPCGLNQLYSLKYGAVPLVRLTGGLRDTVTPWPAPEATGIGFTDVSIAALHQALQQAAQLYQDQTTYQAVQLRGMLQNFSWQSSVHAYQKLYQLAVTEQHSQS